MSPALGGAEAVHDLEQAEAQVRGIERCMDRRTDRRMADVLGTGGGRAGGA